MNPRDLSELKRRLNPDKRHPTLIRGCYVAGDGHVISAFAQAVGGMPQEENEKYMAIFKKVLSGTAGQNLLNVDFTNEDGELTEAQQLLLKLSDTGLRDEDAVDAFFARTIEFVKAESGQEVQSVEQQQAAANYLILLLHDGYDVPLRDNNGEMDHDRSESILNYVLCAVCPVKQTKPTLSYFAAESEFHTRGTDWVVSPPEMGFLYPAFEERSANINRAQYYTRDADNLHDDFVHAVFQAELQLTAKEQQQTFQAILQETLRDECNLGVVQAMHDTISTMIEEQKADKTAEPLTLSRREVTNVLKECGVSEEKAAAFEEKYEESFGEHAELPAVNLVTPKQFHVDTPSVSIRVDPARSDLIETRMIDGRYYILVLADGDVEVNGLKLQGGGHPTADGADMA